MKKLILYIFIIKTSIFFSCSSEKPDQVKEKSIQNTQDTLIEVINIEKPQDTKPEENLNSKNNQKETETQINENECLDPFYKSKNYKHEFILLDSLNGVSIDYFLQHSDVQKEAINFYNRKFDPIDDCHTFNLIDSWKSKNKDLLPFYYYLLIQLDTDGAIAEYFEPVKWSMVENNTIIFFKVLSNFHKSKRKEVIKKFSNSIFEDVDAIIDTDPKLLNEIIQKHFDKVSENKLVNEIEKNLQKDYLKELKIYEQELMKSSR